MPLNPIDRLLDAAASEIRTLDVAIKARVLRALVRGVRRGDGPAAVLAAVRAVLDRFAPVVAAAVGDARLAAWIRGTADVARTVRPSVLAALTRPQEPIPAAVARRVRRVSRDYPVAGVAADWLARRRIVTADVAERIGDQMTWDAFRVGGVEDEKLLRRVRDLLVEQIVAGPDPRAFKRAAMKILRPEGTTLGEVEAVFRTGVRRAYTEAQRQFTDNPVVRAVLPYRLYLATHDGRTRPEHRALETLGLDGTGVYRSDDPMWDWFNPPWDYNCRCEAPYLSIQRAADLGVREAIEWLVGGDPPETPEWRIDHIHFRPSRVLLT